jgi:hypothetical protein
MNKKYNCKFVILIILILGLIACELDSKRKQMDCHEAESIEKCKSENCKVIGKKVNGESINESINRALTLKYFRDDLEFRAEKGLPIDTVCSYLVSAKLKPFFIDSSSRLNDYLPFVVFMHSSSPSGYKFTKDRTSKHCLRHLEIKTVTTECKSTVSIDAHSGPFSGMRTKGIVYFIGNDLYFNQDNEIEYYD